MDEYLIYITKNLITGEVYGGKHIGHRNDKYIGSGPGRFLPAVRQYGYKNFNRRYFKFKIESESQMDRLEIRLIRLLKYIWKERCYNVHVGGSGGYLLKYASPERRLEVNGLISEGKKKQYANGETEAQKLGRKLQSETLKYRNENDFEFREKMLTLQRQRAIDNKKRQELYGFTEKEEARHKYVGGLKRKYFNLEITQPDGSKITDIVTYSELLSKYNIEATIAALFLKRGEYIIKKRTSMTRHSFPNRTLLKNLGYVNPEHECEGDQNIFISKKPRWNFIAILPDNITILEDNNIFSGDLRRNYHLEDAVIKKMKEFGEFIIKKREVGTRHNFPIKTILKLTSIKNLS